MTADEQRGRVYVIDDDDEFRRSMALLLRAAGLNPGHFNSASAFLNEAPSLPPAPLLLDIRMPGISGVELLESGLLDQGKFPTVAVTGHGDVETAVRSLKAGAVDFLEKPFTVEDVLGAVAGAASRLQSTGEQDELHRQARDRVAQLTTRELNVLQGMVAGAPYKVIAHLLGISPRTVEMHREKLLRKLQIRTNAEAVRVAVLASVAPLDQTSLRAGTHASAGFSGTHD